MGRYTSAEAQSAAEELAAESHRRWAKEEALSMIVDDITVLVIWL